MHYRPNSSDARRLQSICCGPDSRAAQIAADTDQDAYVSVQMLSEQLLAVFRNALRSVRVGGTVVYSTCTLSPMQNECVVENAVSLARDHYGMQIVEVSITKLENHLKNTTLFRFTDRCRRGTLIVPNVRSNFGPMYVCKLMRTQ